ncbi:hypothetical protein [Amycolatopsis sp. lyj-112]|uniref:hypothetical protein n=1 Tax=Amycolatopsis sp. lyj-112 TaxID=2789288 RepID=UPI0039793746
MQVIGPDDPLPARRIQRIAVAGPAGSGKSTLARILCERMGLPFVEFESFFHGPGWTVRETWQADVLEFLTGNDWAIEWQGEEVREQLTGRLDALVWLDHPRTLTVTRVVVRTLKRRAGRGSKIAGGNVEVRCARSSPIASTSSKSPGGTTRSCGRASARSSTRTVIRNSSSSGCAVNDRSIAGFAGHSRGTFAEELRLRVPHGDHVDRGLRRRISDTWVRPRRCSRGGGSAQRSQATADIDHDRRWRTPQQ